MAVVCCSERQESADRKDGGGEVGCLEAFPPFVAQRPTPRPSGQRASGTEYIRLANVGNIGSTSRNGRKGAKGFKCKKIPFRALANVSRLFFGAIIPLDLSVNLWGCPPRAGHVAT